MTLYDEAKMTELQHTSAVQRSITSEIGIRDGSPMVCWSPTKTNSPKQAKFENMHGYWFISLGQQEHACL